MSFPYTEEQFRKVMSARTPVPEHRTTGAVFTRPEVVSYMMREVMHAGHLPDIQRGGNVALDERGEYYPHHNVYWITSDTWNMRALCVLMRSSFVTDQIRRVSVQMRGGSIRYQAQNLRHVHIPAWSSLDEADVMSLAGLYEEADVAKVDRFVESLLAKVVGRQPKKLVVQEFDFAV